MNKKCQYPLITPSKKIIDEIEALSKIYHFSENDMKNIEYHFNLGHHKVNLADTKSAMLNYDIRDTIDHIDIYVPKEEKETITEYRERKQAVIRNFKNKMLKYYHDFKQEIYNILKPVVDKMSYNDLYNLFISTWNNTPFEEEMEQLLQDMVILLGNKAVMQNVIGESGTFKSTRSMIEFNCFPNVLIIDDATVAGISRDSISKGIDYMDDTIVYYNDIGDSSVFRKNFEEVLETIYKKLFSEGYINRTVARKNSDNTIHLELKTPHGFKGKFNSVRPIFMKDLGQTASRVQNINLQNISIEDVEQMIDDGTFGRDDAITQYDPRIFKNIFEVYIKSQNTPELSKEHMKQISQISYSNLNHVVNMHDIGREIYINQMMIKLYKTDEEYIKYYWNVRKQEGTNMINALKLLEEIQKMVKHPFKYDQIPRSINDNVRIAKAKSAYAHAGEYEYNAFTINAVRGIKSKWIREHQGMIGDYINILKENMAIAVIDKENDKNVYVLLK